MNIKAAKKSAMNGNTSSLGSDAEFKAALEEFERSLVRPVISGELSTWIQEVQDSWRQVADQIHYQIKHLNPRQYEEIAQQDPTLLPRIDSLKAEDAAIEEQREMINQSVVRVGEHIPNLEPDEAKAEKFTKSLVDDCLAFIARIRKQMVAMQTWYIEAFNRDSGAVD